mmetsp:Transcript_10176/g.62033  ORF Transcript_10176/g.62033 Transcript_10176/m.62033 type:complete len:300 (-) Transcript_10176:1003-1902(-)
MQPMKAHPQVAVEDAAPAVHGQGPTEVVLCHVVLLLTEIDLSQPKPRIVLAHIDPDGRAVACHGLIKVLVCKVLVSAQSMGVGKVLVQLQCPLEKAHRSAVILLQAEVVAHGAPGRGAPPVQGRQLSCQVHQLRIPLEMPQRRGVVFHPRLAMRGHLSGPLEGAGRLGVICHFVVRSSHLAKNPSRGILVRGDFQECLCGLLAMIHAKQEVRFGHGLNEAQSLLNAHHFFRRSHVPEQVLPLRILRAHEGLWRHSEAEPFPAHWAGRFSAFFCQRGLRLVLEQCPSHFPRMDVAGKFPT